MIHDSDGFQNTFASIAIDASLPDPDGAPALPGSRNYRIYCDESGIHGAEYIGFGGLIMPHERRGDFTGMVDKLRNAHDFHHEIKWAKVSSRNVDFCEALIGEFFKRTSLLFHCLVVQRSYVDMQHHADYDEVKRKFFALFLEGRLKFLNGRATDKAYHVIVDPLPSRYAKADEATAKIVNNTLKRDLGLPLVTKLITRDSKAAVGIQVADLLLGATLAGWQKEITSAAKLRVTSCVAQHLGWADTSSDTFPREAKFNIWHFQDPRDPRRIRTRQVKLRIPCPILVTKK